MSPLQSEWDSIYGKGFYVAHVLGARLYAQATLRGNRGTVVDVEMYRSVTEDDPGHEERGPVRGVAQDNHGNTYKIAEF